MYTGLHVVSDFNENWNFRDRERFPKNTQTSNLTNIRPVGTELFRGKYGQTDRQTL
jgi:hypothetical protein